MEEDNYKYISLSDSELSMVDEGIYKNIPTAEIDIDTFLEYSPTTEPISFSSSIKNYLPSQPLSPIQNQIDEAPLILPIEYLSAAREWLISIVMMSEHSSNEATIPTLPANETKSDLQQKDWMFQPLFEIPSSISIENSSPLSIPSLLTMQTNQTISTINQDTNMEHYDDIIFNDIDQIVNHH